MADNVVLNQNVTNGAIIATDDVGGAQHQYVKVEFGADGVATPVSSANPLPIQQVGTPELPADAATETTLASVLAQLVAGIGVAVANFPATQAVTGTFFQATQPVSGTFFQATQPVSIAATVTTKEVTSGTGTGSTASISTSATVLASNSNRLGATIYNESGGACRIKLGASASATDYTMIIAIGGYYEVPFAYTGIITGIAVSGTAALRVNELT